MSVHDRYVEVEQPDGSWLRKEVEDLRAGDVFTMFEWNGNPVSMNNDNTTFIFRALADPVPMKTLNGQDTWGVKADPA